MHAGDLGGRLVVADRDQRTPHTGADEVAHQQEHQDRQHQEHVVAPLVVGETRPVGRAEAGLEQELAPTDLLQERRVAVPLARDQPASDRRTGDVAEADHDLREQRRERQRDQGEVDAGDAQCRQADDQPDDEREGHGDDARDGVGDAVVHGQDHRDVGAHPQEGAVTEGDLAVEAGQQCQRERGDRDVDDLAEPVDVTLGEHLGCHDRECSQHHPEHDAPPHDGAHHARPTLAVPNRPWGRTSRTMSTSRKPGSSRRSGPISPT